MTDTERALRAAKLYLAPIKTRAEQQHWLELTGSQVIGRDVVLDLIRKALAEQPK